MRAAKFAGSAIKQNAGKLSNIDEWSPSTKERRWLLIAGSSHPPANVPLSERRIREEKGAKSGKYLQGISLDLFNMEKAIGHTLKNKVQNLEITKSEAESHIKKFFQFCKDGNYKPMLYYTGHGEMSSGNWCLSDGTIGIEEIFKWVPVACDYPTICSDACYSGAWANYCIRKGVDGFECLSACDDCQSAFDNKDCGGELTLYMTGNANKLRGGRPTTEPLFSRGVFDDFPTLRKYTKVHYSEFIKSFTHDDKKILLWQSIHDRYMHVVFGSHESYNNRKKIFWSSPNYHEMSQKLKQHHKEGYNIFSLACDQKTGKFFAYMVEDYGTSQSIIQSSEPNTLVLNNCSVTSCTVYKSTYYFVVTGGVEEFEGKDQEIFTRQSKSDDFEREINNAKSRGMIITSSCYNSKAMKYLFVMTQSSHKQQEHACFKDEKRRAKWVDEMYKENYVLSILLEDPLEFQDFCVLTRDNKHTNRDHHRFEAATLYD